MDLIIFAFWMILAFNGVAFLMGYFLQTDKFTDITYNLSFFVVTLVLLLKVGDFSLLKVLLGGMVLVWSLRLGTYLFVRILKIRHDARFDSMRPSFVRFLGFWVLQTVSIFIIMLPVIVVLGKNIDGLGVLSWVGFGIWLLGFLMETIADYQKYVFKNENPSKFMRTGLWKYSRHPNYLGEIMCWVGIFVFCAPFLVGLEWLSIISPIWIFTLLMWVSGIPLLEKSADQRYGHLSEYQTYKSETGVLFPKR